METPIEIDYSLVKPDLSYEHEWNSAIASLMQHDGRIVPNNLYADNYDHFLSNIEMLASGENLPRGYVRSELFFFVCNQEPGKILGITDLRLGTTQMIEQYYGHAGGCILPPYRSMGLGTRIIGLTLDKFIEKKIANVILTCENWNTASRQAIISNGGKFLGNSYLADKIYERYFISLL